MSNPKHRTPLPEENSHIEKLSSADSSIISKAIDLGQSIEKHKQREPKEYIQTENKRGEWVPSIPLPFYGLKKKCGCGKSFWKEKNYKAHYALEHIVLGELPL